MNNLTFSPTIPVADSKRSFDQVDDENDFIPPFIHNNLNERKRYRQDMGELMWKPDVISHLTSKEVELYLDLACTACVTGGGRNKEYALHLLYRCHGNFKLAITELLKSSSLRSSPLPKRIPENSSNQENASTNNDNLIKKNLPEYPYSYPECDKWTLNEIELYNIATVKHEKNFFKISNDIKTKNVKQCVEFYYFWKKVCINDYERMRSRIYQKEQSQLQKQSKAQAANNYHRKIQDMHQDLNNNNQINSFVSKPANNNNSYYQQLNSNDNFSHYHVHCANHGARVCSPLTTLSSASSSSGSSLISVRGGHSFIVPSNPIVVHPTEGRSNTAAFVAPTPPVGPGPGSEEFPCKVCGRVFYKIKSRSAHMKRHKNEH